jgi:hypothetical protein
MKMRDTDNAERYVAEHPVVRTHPETGRKALYVNTRHTVRFKDMTDEESRPLIDFLQAHCTRPEFTARLRWQKGTIGIWDNPCCQHFAINDYHGQRRVCGACRSAPNCRSERRLELPSIVGTWKLVGAERARPTARRCRPLWREGHGTGRADRRGAHDGGGVRRAAGIAGRDDPRLQLLLRQLHLRRRTARHRVDAASDPARIGSDQVREVSFDDDKMILRPPPRRQAGEEYRELTWARIAAE